VPKPCEPHLILPGLSLAYAYCAKVARREGAEIALTYQNERFRERAAEWQKRWELVGEARGLGAMQALELVRSRRSREPAELETKQASQYCYEHGLITITAGTYSNVIRLLMPLVITDAQMDEGLDVLESALQAVCDRKKEAAAQPV